MNRIAAVLLGLLLLVGVALVAGQPDVRAKEIAPVQRSTPAPTGPAIPTFAPAGAEILLEIR